MSPVATSTLRRGLGALRLARGAVRLSRAEEAVVADHARRHLAESMGALRGLPQKVGQILSMSGGDGAGAYAPLTGRARPLPFAVVERVLAAEWGRPCTDVLAALEPEARAASLGQVHAGRLADGREVAVKVQYPGIAEAVETDLRLLGWLTLPVGGLARGFNLPAYRSELLRDLGEELDYRREAAHQQAYARMAAALPGVVVPAVHEALCTPRVLVSDWEPGAPLERVAHQWPAADRAAAASLLLRHSLETLFRHGRTQGDLHPGNLAFRTGADGRPELVLYDFGCVFRPEPAARQALLRLIAITEAHGGDDPFPWFVALGFDRDYLEPLAPRLPALCRVLFEPFLLDGAYDLGAWRLGERVADILGEERWNFRVAGPARLIWLMRVFHGLIHALRTLGQPVPWRHALAPVRRDLDGAAAALRPPVAARRERSFATMARHLIIRVRRDGETRVKLASPLHVIDNLEAAMDQEVLERVRRRRIDLADLAARARASGYAPQELFRLDDGDREVRVWLE